MTRSILPAVIHAVNLTVEERAALLAAPAPAFGFVTMRVVDPRSHPEPWVGYGAGQRALFRQDTDGIVTVIVPREMVNGLSRAGFVLQ